MPSILPDVDEALRLDPRDGVARSLRASILFRLERFDDALAE